VVRANRGLERLELGSVQTVAGREFTALLADLGVLDDALQAVWPEEAGGGEAGALPPDLESVGTWLWDRWRRALAEGPIIADSLRTPLGRSFELRIQHSLSATPEEDPLPHYVAVLQDVTERNRARDLLEDFNRRLRAQVAAKTASLRWANRRLQMEIEEHKLHKAALELSEYRYHSFVDKTLTGIYLAERGVITYHNRRFARLLGVDEGDLIGARLEDVLGPACEQSESLADDLGEVTSGQECQVRARDGRLLWLHHIQAAYDGGSRDIVIGNLLDITASKEFEERLLLSSQRNAELSKRLLISQEEERARLARELHDGVGQRINAVKLMLDGIIRECDRGGGSPFRGHLLQLAVSLRETVDEVRQVSMALRPSMLDDLGIRATLSWFAREIGRCVPYLRIHLDHDDVDEAAMSALVKTAIFRITQEAVNNVAKHAEASAVDISLQSDAREVVLTIRDNGEGMSGAVGQDSWGVGLRSMRERAALSGGDLAIVSRDGGGVTLIARWPIEPLSEPGAAAR
jgi:PAS domain S-box-containing protein